MMYILVVVARDPYVSTKFTCCSHMYGTRVTINRRQSRPFHPKTLEDHFFRNPTRHKPEPCLSRQTQWDHIPCLWCRCWSPNSPIRPHRAASDHHLSHHRLGVLGLRDGCERRVQVIPEQSSRSQCPQCVCAEREGPGGFLMSPSGASEARRGPVWG